MITLIYGSDISASRKALKDEIERQKPADIIPLSGPKVDIPDCILALETNSLFSLKKIVVIENLLKGPASKKKDTILKYLAEQEDATTIMWEDRTLQKTALNKIKGKMIALKYDLPGKLFSFLESVGSLSQKETVIQFHELLRSQDAELIFSMLLRQIRYLIIASDRESGAISELPPWQASKYRRQASYYSPDQWLAAYRQLLSIDYKIKSGATPLKMNQLLDIFFLSI